MISYGNHRFPGKLFVVATQTIEVGANIDFDALVTEAATLDALRQRFGRLDRLGELKKTCAAVVLRKADKGKEDPVYGEDLKQAWDWLKRQANGSANVDFGINALKEKFEAAVNDAVPDRVHRDHVVGENAARIRRGVEVGEQALSKLVSLCARP